MSHEILIRGEILVVDDDKEHRESIRAQLENNNLRCHEAANVRDALDCLKNRRDIRLVIVDQPVAPGGDLPALITSMQRLQPQAMFVGSSEGDRREEFTHAGVALFLKKPWQILELRSLLRECIGQCAMCGLPLPLRRPLASETGQSWECSYCQARYFGVIDEESSSEIRLNARSVAAR